MRFCNRLVCCIGFCFVSIFTLGMECQSAPDNNNNANNNDNTNDNTNVSNLVAVVTGIELHVQADIVAGDDVIAFGTGGFSGVQYVIPSANDTAGRDIPGGSNFVAGMINVVGKKIICYSSDFAAHVYDTETDTVEDVALNEVRLTNLPIGKAGRVTSGDGYVVVRCDDGEVDDGNQLKMIDVSDNTPVVVPFTSYPAGTSDFAHAAVDKTRNQVVAVDDEKLLFYDAANPDAAPTEVDTSTNMVNGQSNSVDNSVPIYADDGVVLFISSPDGLAFLYLVDSDSYVQLSTNRAGQADYTLRAGSYGIFLNEVADDSIGSDLRSGIGTVSSTEPTFADVEDLRFEGTTNGGAFGYGQEIEVTTDGGTWFICGSESIGSAETLQVSSGGKFVNVPDPAGVNELGVPATDVSISDNVIAFKSGAQQDTVVAYIILN
ncbi:MAG: hypothetical protein IPK83_20095 [Planctomycetes bacterium]|nr:hypothetical protein [Planctomycetota bacterium]